MFLETEGTLLPDGSHEAPSLARFEVQIARFRSLEEEINSQPSSLVLGYLRADTQPLKQALVAWLSKWIFLYTQCLQAGVCSVCSEF